ncbi:efflux RND transporter periplasmic adaptor subunit [Xanthomonas bromi]|uniref:efflux RND transporter periplasmic adaptor subunit n=1 Tax=Xanthomonas bromi TaxID=56449 RepID=UPI001428AFDA|nr:efflux RND transporter periplasmic adaptor subunit [Xanthomonas bromi]
MVLAIGAWALRGTERADAAAASPVAPPEVEIQVAVASDIPASIEAPGNTVAFNTIHVRSRVSGRIEEILFTAGEEVRAGQPLFRIDDRRLRAQLAQARAQEALDQATLEQRRRELSRVRELAPAQLVSRQAVDELEAKTESAVQQVSFDRATIAAAASSLSDTLVRSPLSGRVGVKKIDIGNVVLDDEERELVTINQIHPIRVEFSVRADQLPDIRKQKGKGAMKVEVLDATSSTTLAVGHLSTIDNGINPATGMIRLDAEFENVDEQLWPGQFVKVRLHLAPLHDVPTVPVSSLLRGDAGWEVLRVSGKGIVERLRVSRGACTASRCAVARGLSVGDRIITSGMHEVTDGDVVRIVGTDVAGTDRP